MSGQHKGKDHADRTQEIAVEDSFPASDPPAHTGVTGPGGTAERGGDKRRPPDQRDDAERPTGTPTSDRHATETAFVWEHEDRPPGAQ
jgi:hypothetical protein